MNTSCRWMILRKWCRFPKTLDQSEYRKNLCTAFVNSTITVINDDADIQQKIKSNYKSKVSKTVENVDKFVTTNLRIRPFVNEVTKLGISEFQIASAIMKTPKIMDYDLTVAASCMLALYENGFNSEHIVSMIMNYPQLLRLNHNDIVSSIEVWRSSHLGEKFFLRLFSDYPHLLDLDNELVKNRIQYIKHHMGGKLGRVTDLLINSPDVLYANWYQIEYKLNYLLIRMGITEKQIAESTVLSHPISHIKLRHSFLEKIGIYKTPNPKNKGFSPHKNPPLKMIIDTNDETFASHVARIKLNEYESYKNMFENYMEEEKETFDDDSDSEDEIDDYETDPDDTYEDYKRNTLD